MIKLSCFKAYDIRGKLGSEIDETIAYKIGLAYARYLKPALVVLGCDVRESSKDLKMALANGIRDYGADVIDIGMVGTEQVYFATSFLRADGGIEVTASHNPIDYNGMKLVRDKSKPISSDSGLLEIKKIAESIAIESLSEERKGKYRTLDLLNEYLDHLIGYADFKNFREPLRVVMNAGNGSAGPVVDAFQKYFQSEKIPIEIIKVNNTPDGKFPNGIPNPLLKENRASTISAVLDHKADVGIAWDGDFDRCFFVDEQGRFIEGYYIVGLLTQAFLKKIPGGRVIHDPRLTWNTLEIANRCGGEAIQSKTGHAFIKEKMRLEDAIYGGEMSAHHYFKDFFYCDSGMIPWILILELVILSGNPLSSMVNAMMLSYPSPGELNFSVNDPRSAIDSVYRYFKPSAKAIDYTDGISMEFDEWRFNLRSSNTEPVVRLNLETRGDFGLMKKYQNEISHLLRNS